MHGFVIWEGSSHTVSAGKGDLAIKYKIGQAKAERNGQTATLDYPGKIIDGSTMMPVRFVAEAFGAAVGWDESTKTVNISSPPKQLAEIVRVLDGFYLEVKYQNFRGENVQENVRLAGISPIHNGMDATVYTQKILPIGSKVLIEARGSRDRNKHLRADVYLSDNSLLNAKLVADGYAILSANLKDEKLNAMLVSLQREAKVQKSGLWAQQDQAGLPTTIKKVHPFKG
ncbi:stalk domain-containing protein [Paenibacillus sp. LjRoot153]|uniref:stalk domain-containing protein n=1 Tax=Paenibacillus sp. LjRoot153 TaxID=3342270 RepID=UPI003ECC30E5